MKNLTTSFVVLGLALLGSACVSKSVYLKENQRADSLNSQLQSANSQLQSANSQLQSTQSQLKTTQQDLDAQKQENAELQKTLDAKKGELNQRLAELSKQNQDLTAMIRITQQNRDEEIAKLKGSYDELVNGLKTELQAGQVTITQLKGRLSVNMVDKILFNSGEADVKQEGQKVLQNVGDVLKKLQDKDIRIEGYTDNVPISGSLRGKYQTNWELSTARATAVVRYLEEKVGIPQDHLIAAGYGETHPIASNDTPEGRQQNRRIEIVLVPRDTSDTAPTTSSTTTPSPAP